MTTSADVPGRVPVAINGHAFMAEPTIERTTVQVIRQQADASPEAGEQTLSPLGLWRRSQESWHHGAGQPFLDGRQGDSPTDPHRFRSSKGIDPWTRGQVSLLHPTLKAWSSTNTNLYLAVAQDAGVYYLYVADGNELYWNALPYTFINTFAFQTGTGWLPANSTIAAFSTGFQLTATAGAAVSATSPIGTAGMPVEAGRRYGLAFASLYISGGGAKFTNVRINWYDAAGASLGASATATSGSTDAGAGTVLYTNAFAPANAAFASITIGYTTNWAAAEVHRVTGVSFGPYEDVSPFPAPEQWAISSIQAGDPAQPIKSVATNGFHVWAALGTSGLHRTAAGGGGSTADVPAAPASGQISLVGWANGLLFAAGSAGTSATRQNTLWFVSGPLDAVPVLTLIKTHVNTSFVWTGIGPGRGCVYAWGNSGGIGEVYKILIDPNTGVPSPAASFATYLPDGETIHALQFYAGGIIMGTGKGLRIGTADGSGNIEYGPLISTDWPVLCLEPQDRYCWFGWTKYDALTSGLGRIDLGFLTDTLTPAWASDLMTNETTTGDVVGCVTFEPYGYTANQRPPVRVFSVAGKGVYIEDPTSRVNAGTLLTGAIRYSTSEPKTTRSVDIRHHSLPAATDITVSMERDSSGVWEGLGGSSVDGSYGITLSANDETAEAMELRLELGRPGPIADYTVNPELTRWTAKVLPTPSTIDETFAIPIIMTSDSLTNQGDGTPYPIDVPAEIAYLKGLERSRALIDIQVGEELVSGCYVVGSQFKPWRWSDGQKFLEGLFIISIQTARG